VSATLTTHDGTIWRVERHAMTVPAEIRLRMLDDARALFRRLGAAPLLQDLVDAGWSLPQVRLLGEAVIAQVRRERLRGRL